MTIAQVIAGCAHEASGTSYYIMNMCRALSKAGLDITLHSFDAQVRPEDGFASVVHKSSNGLLHALGWCPSMLRGLKNAAKEVDIIHTNGVWLMTNVYPAWVKNDRVKIVQSPHGMLNAWALANSRWKKRLFGILWQYRALAKADMFHATSEKEYEEIRALGYKQPVALIPIGIDVPDLPKVEKRKSVVFLGRIHQVKAIDRMLQAWEIVANEFPDWDVKIAGPDGGALGELKGFVASRKLLRVSFVGELNGDTKTEFLSSAGILVLPSHTENFGACVIEALAHGVPVIASKGTPWASVEKEHCGRWVENSPEMLARAMRELMSIPEDERRQMGDNGRNWLRREFVWSAIGEKMKMSYEWLLDPVKIKRPEWVRL